MKFLRWVAASLLGLVAGIVGLLGVVLTATLVLAPIGIPLLFLARRLFGVCGRLVVPHAVRHPLDALDQTGSDATADMKKAIRKKWRRGSKDARKKTRRLGKRVREKAPGS
jgi:hypothetical protein